jgi:hypothetical protein
MDADLGLLPMRYFFAQGATPQSVEEELTQALLALTPEPGLVLSLDRFVEFDTEVGLVAKLLEQPRHHERDSMVRDVLFVILVVGLSASPQDAIVGQYD